MSRKPGAIQSTFNRKLPQMTDISLKNCQSYLHECRAQEIASLRADIESLRHSAAFQLGCLCLSLWPPGRGSVQAVRSLFALWRSRPGRRLRAGSGSAQQGASPAPTQGQEHSAHADCLVHVGVAPLPATALGVVFEADTAAVVAHMARGGVRRLVLRLPDPQLARCVGRWRRAGCQLVWWPLPEMDAGDPVALYLEAQVHAVFPPDTPLEAIV